MPIAAVVAVDLIGSHRSTILLLLLLLLIRSSSSTFRSLNFRQRRIHGRLQIGQVTARAVTTVVVTTVQY